MDVRSHTTAQLFVQLALLSTEQAHQYQQAAEAATCRLIPYLVEHEILSAKSIASALAAHFNLPYIDLDSITIAPKAHHLISKTLLLEHQILPLFCQHHQLYVALDDPSQHGSLQDIQFHTGLNVVPMVAETTQLLHYLNLVLTQKEQQGLTDYFEKQIKPMVNTPNTLDDPPIIKFVNRILEQAIAKQASDIHLEPDEHDYRIRYRQDGLLHEIARHPQSLAIRIAARLKVMANLDISERRLPQDGRFTLSKDASSTIDCRLSTCPTIHGEKIVIRLLNTGFSTKPEIEALSLNARDRSCFLEALARPQGLILVTGPTGSGKSMTLYSALNHLNTGERNISTAEDPVELKLSGINQVQVNHKIHLNFATILRAFLRQDPDILMIGEIRDLETAEIAIKAAQTGHLVLSTLHTNSAADTLFRLINLGIPAFHLVHTTRLIIAQRLVRRLCGFCKYRRDDIAPSMLTDLGYKHPVQSPFHLYEAQGCHHCTQGYAGRIAIFELMPMSLNIAQTMMQSDRKMSNLVQQAQDEGMSTLLEAGFSHVLSGVTSLLELHRVI